MIILEEGIKRKDNPGEQNSIREEKYQHLPSQGWRVLSCVLLVHLVCNRENWTATQDYSGRTGFQDLGLQTLILDPCSIGVYNTYPGVQWRSKTRKLACCCACEQPQGSRSRQIKCIYHTEDHHHNHLPCTRYCYKCFLCVMFFIINNPMRDVPLVGPLK